MLRINADTPEMLVAAMATPDPTLQKLLRSQLAWRVDKTRMDVPSWFDVNCRPSQRLNLQAARRLTKALARLAEDPDSAVRDAAVRALAGAQGNSSTNGRRPSTGGLKALTSGSPYIPMRRLRRVCVRWRRWPRRRKRRWRLSVLSRATPT